MANLLPWNRTEFQEIYVEALVQAEHFTEAALRAIRESSAGNDAIAKEQHELAETHHGEAVRLLARLSIRFYKKIGNKKFSNWSEQQVKNNVRLRALSKWISATMSALLDNHRLTLVALQIVNISESED
jgi:hypothetical protein